MVIRNRKGSITCSIKRIREKIVHLKQFKDPDSHIKILNNYIDSLTQKYEIL